MSETTKLPASFSNGAVFESSTAFLMIQKNANKRQTSMTDDVFRIFRRTGKKINEIASRIESERNIYLKTSYSDKNSLYKELSGIANVKHGQNAAEKTRRAKIFNHIGQLPRFSTVNTSDLICRPVKSQLGRQKLGEEVDLEPEKRLNVNVLKRCECCRRLAFRYKELNEKKEEQEGEDKDGTVEDEAQKNTSETQKLTDEILASVKPGIMLHDTESSGSKSSKFFLYDRKISINEVVPTSFNALRKQSKAVLDSPQRKVTIALPVTAPPSPVKEHAKNISRSRSYSVLMNPDRNPALVRPEPTPSPLSRQKIRVKFTNPTSGEKVKIRGNAWSNHIRKLQDQDTGEKQSVVTLSKGYLAFKKLLRQMEEERRREEEAWANEDASPTSSTRNSPIPRNRFKNTAVSVAASLRWQPRKSLSQRTFSIIGEDVTKDTTGDVSDHVNNDVIDVNKGEQVSQDAVQDDNVSIQPNVSDDDNSGIFTVLEWNGSTRS